jgi:hypothetical protein
MDKNTIIQLCIVGGVALAFLWIIRKINEIDSRTSTLLDAYGRKIGSMEASIGELCGFVAPAHPSRVFRKKQDPTRQENETKEMLFKTEIPKEEVDVSPDIDKQVESVMEETLSEEEQPEDVKKK